MWSNLSSILARARKLFMNGMLGNFKPWNNICAWRNEAEKCPNPRRHFKGNGRTDCQRQYFILHVTRVPEGATILPSVWQIKDKWDIKTTAAPRVLVRIGKSLVIKDHAERWCKDGETKTIRIKRGSVQISGLRRMSLTRIDLVSNESIKPDYECAATNIRINSSMENTRK